MEQDEARSRSEPRSRSRSESRSRSRSEPRSRSASPAAQNGKEEEQEEEVLSENEVERSSSANPDVLEVVSEELCRTSNAVFVKRWCRGQNSCCRTDIEFEILPSSKWAHQREDRLTRPVSSGSKVKHRTYSTSSTSRQSASVSPSNSASTHRTKDSRRDDKMSPVPIKKRADSEMKGLDEKASLLTNASSFLPVGSSLLGRPGYGWAGPHYPLGLPPFGYPPGGGYGPLDHPALRGMYPTPHDPTPALRQLSEYAKPHISNSNADFSASSGGGGLYSKITGPAPISTSSLYSARDRHEAEQERHQRSNSRGSSSVTAADTGRDTQWEDNKDRVKQEIIDQKPLLSNTERASSRGGALGPLGPPPLGDGQLSAELHKRYLASYSLAGGPITSQSPAAASLSLTAAAAASSLYQPSSLTADWFQRERMEMLGIRPNLFSADPAERIAAERLYADRLNAERTNAERLSVERIAAERFAALQRDPLYRHDSAAAVAAGSSSLAAAAARSTAAASAAEQSHTHTHSHTHLHLHQPDTAAAAAVAPLFPAAAAAAPFHPMMMSPHLAAAYGLTTAESLAAAAAGGPSAAAALQQSGIPGLAAVAAANPHAAAYSMVASQQLMAAAQEQEMIYRELMCRPPYSTDPILAQQLMAQAFAQQEAIQRQLALLPHHQQR